MRPFPRRSYATTKPLTGDQIRACEAAVAARANASLPASHEPSQGDVGDIPANPSPKHPQGGNPPNPPNPHPHVVGGCGLGMGGVGGITPPPYPPTVSDPGRDVGGLGGMDKTKTRAKTKKPLLTIIEDCKEKTPLTDWPEGVAVIRRNLHTGDYSAEGWENCFAIERKSLQDLAGTMLGDYEASSEKPKKRFNRELERLRHFDCAAVIVTASPQEVIDFHHHCGMDAHGALWGFAHSIFANYRIPVFYLSDERIAARWVADLARHYIVARTKKHFTKEDRSLKAIAEWTF